MRKQPFTLLIVMALVFMLVFAGCSSSKGKSAASNGVSNGISAEQAPSAPAPASSTPVLDAAKDRKIIQRLFYTMETKTFMETQKHILDTMTKFGGYVEGMSQTGSGETQDAYSARRVDMILRVPSKSLENFVSEFVGDAVVIENRLETEDATEQFFDTEAHLKTLRIQEERLLKLLEQSVKLEDMIVLESRLSEVRYEIENLQGTLNKLSQLVNYSVVTIQLAEVKDVLKIQVTQNSYFNRALETFMRSVQNLFAFVEELSLGLIGIAPLLIILAPFVFFYRWIIKRHPQYKIFKKTAPQKKPTEEELKK